MAENEMTVEDLFEGVYSELDNPSQTVLNPSIALQKLLDAIQYYLNKMNLSSTAFLLAQKKINLIRGVEEYKLNDVDNFGKGLYISIGAAFDDTIRQRSSIPIIDAATQTLYDAPYNTLGGAIIYRDGNGILTLRMRPIPSTDVEGIIWYKPARQDILDFTDKPKLLSQFFVNVRLRAARSLVPKTRYTAPKKKDLLMGIEADLQDNDLLFNLFLNSGDDTGGIKRPSMPRLYYGDGY